MTMTQLADDILSAPQGDNARPAARRPAAAAVAVAVEGLHDAGASELLPPWAGTAPAIARVPASPVAAWLKVLVPAAMIALAAASWLTWDALVGAVDSFRHHALGQVFFVGCQVLLAIHIVAFIWRLVLVLRYRPAATCTDAELPACCVVVPAYNEGRGVYDTLVSLIRSDYPPGKLQIITVDDGSLDDTWQWMQRAAGEFPGQILTLRLNHNRGKRHALYEAFRAARADVLVTVDSDCVVAPSAIRRLVSPMVRSADVSAVAGNVRVLNREAGLLPRMLDVNFAYSFDFMRSSQSEVNTVMCTPGALAGYRRSVVMGVLQEWVNQRFCGRAANIGEDRALTNLILREGHLCHFQQDAMCYTKVPAGYAGLCRMFLRWARSNVRETIAMGGFLFGRFRRQGALGARVNFITQAIDMIAGPLLLAAAIGTLIWHPGIYSIHILTGVFIASAVPAIFYAIRERSSDCLLALPYGVFNLVALSWIGAYSLMTPHKSSWLTRG